MATSFLGGEARLLSWRRASRLLSACCPPVPGVMIDDGGAEVGTDGAGLQVRPTRINNKMKNFEGRGRRE